MSKPLILASSSPYRRELLERLRLPFTCFSPDVDETRQPEESPEAMVLRLSQAKARAVATALASQYPDALIIGSDQCAVLDGQVLGKPGTEDKAMEQLRASSGRCVTLHTGLCLYDGDSGAEQLDRVDFKVHFRVLSDAEIQRYIALEQPLNCAGSVKSEGLGVALFERLEGEDPSALIGLPLIRLTRMLRDAGHPVI